MFNFSLSLFLSHENIVPLRQADFRRDRLSEKLHGFDVSLGAVDVRASLTDQLRDGPLLWIQSREYAMLRKVRLAARPHGTPAASGNQLERARNFSPGCNFCVPWHYARVFINRLVGKFAQTVLKPNRWEIRRSNWSVSVLLYCRWRISRTPLCTGEIFTSAFRIHRPLLFKRYW